MILSVKKKKSRRLWISDLRKTVSITLPSCPQGQLSLMMPREGNCLTYITELCFSVPVEEVGLTLFLTRQV